MSIPTGYEKLAVIGIAWKGEYAQGTAYKTMNGVYYKGSTYVALRDNPTGQPAADGANWQYLAKGFEQQLLSAVTALDTSGVLGQAGASVGGQALMDAIADKVMTKLVERSSIVQTESTSTTTAPSSAYFKQVTDRVISDLDDKANTSELAKYFPKNRMCPIYLDTAANNGYITKQFPWPLSHDGYSIISSITGIEVSNKTVNGCTFHKAEWGNNVPWTLVLVITNW